MRTTFGSAQIDSMYENIGVVAIRELRCDGDKEAYKSGTYCAIVAHSNSIAVSKP